MGPWSSLVPELSLGYICGQRQKMLWPDIRRLVSSCFLTQDWHECFLHFILKPARLKLWRTEPKHCWLQCRYVLLWLPGMFLTCLKVLLDEWEKCTIALNHNTVAKQCICLLDLLPCLMREFLEDCLFPVMTVSVIGSFISAYKLYLGIGHGFKHWDVAGGNLDPRPAFMKLLSYCGSGRW